MGEATGPVVPLSAVSGEEMLAIRVKEAAAEFRKAQALYRALWRGETRPPVEVIDHSHRLSELDSAIRKGAMFELTRGPLETPPLAAVPGPGRHRRARQHPPGDRPVQPPLLRAVPAPSDYSPP